MRVVVVGDQGLLGREFAGVCLAQGIQYLGLNRSNCDLSLTARELQKYFLPGDSIVNCVAYTNVEGAEANRVEAFLVNEVYAGKLAAVAKNIQGRIIHMSTDYVFSGDSGTAYMVGSTPNPLSVYGKSKLAGEQVVQHSGAEYTIVRTAWLYGQFGDCFPKRIAGSLRTAGRVSVVDDQHGQPTWANDVAERIISILTKSRSHDIVHLVSEGKASWADFASSVATSLGYDGERVIIRVPSSEFKTFAPRPANSTLDTSQNSFRSVGQWSDRWLIASSDVLKEMLSS